MDMNQRFFRRRRRRHRLAVEERDLNTVAQVTSPSPHLKIVVT